MTLTKKEWDALSEDEKIERADEEPESKEEEETDEEGVPWKNRAKEFERKFKESSQETESLKTQIQELQNKFVSSASEKEKKNATEKLKKTLSDLGYEEDAIVEGIIDSVKDIAEEKIQGKIKDLETKIGNTGRYALESARKSILSNFEKEDSYGLTTKYKKEIEAELDTYPPEYWGNEKVIETAIALVEKRHRSEILKSGIKAKESAPTETEPHTKGAGRESAQDEEEREYADRQGITLKEAREIMALRKKALEKK